MVADADGIVPDQVHRQGVVEGGGFGAPEADVELRAREKVIPRRDHDHPAVHPRFGFEPIYQRLESVNAAKVLQPFAGIYQLGFAVVVVQNGECKLAGRRRGRHNLKDGYRSAHLVGDDQQVLPCRAVRGGYEDEAFGAQVPRADKVAAGGVIRVETGREIPVVDVRDERGRGRQGDIVNHDAADPLKADEGVDAVVDGSRNHGLGFGALVVAAAVERPVFIVVGVEVFGNQIRQTAFEVVTTVEYEISSGIPDGKRPAAVGEQPIVVAVAVAVTQARGRLQPAQVRVILQACGVGKRRGIQHEVGNAGFFAEAVIVPRVPLVRRNHKCPTSGFKRGDCVRLVHAEHRPLSNQDAAISIAGIERVVRRAVVLEAERYDR